MTVCNKELPSDVLFQLGHEVDFSDLIPTFHRTATVPFPQMVDAVKCVRAEGLKTALLTNNWFNAGPDKTFLPLDLSLFDVVSWLLSRQAWIKLQGD